MKGRWWTAIRRLGPMLLGTALVVCIAVAVNLAGIRLIGSIAGWHNWLQAHAGHFLVWRLCLYAALAYGWWFLLRQQKAVVDRSQLRRTEVAALAVIVLLEGGNLLRQST